MQLCRKGSQLLNSRLCLGFVLISKAFIFRLYVQLSEQKQQKVIEKITRYLCVLSCEIFLCILVTDKDKQMWLCRELFSLINLCFSSTPIITAFTKNKDSISIFPGISVISYYFSPISCKYKGAYTHTHIVCDDSVRYRQQHLQITGLKKQRRQEFQ